MHDFDDHTHNSFIMILLIIFIDDDSLDHINCYHDYDPVYHNTLFLFPLLILYKFQIVAYVYNKYHNIMHAWLYKYFVVETYY